MFMTLSSMMITTDDDDDDMIMMMMMMMMMMITTIGAQPRHRTNFLHWRPWLGVKHRSYRPHRPVDKFVDTHHLHRQGFLRFRPGHVPDCHAAKCMRIRKVKVYFEAKKRVYKALVSRCMRVTKVGHLKTPVRVEKYANRGFVYVEDEDEDEDEDGETKIIK